MRIVLASSSPSRKAILESGGVEPIIAPADVDEYAIIEAMAGKPEAKIVEKLASAKADAIAAQYPADVVIGADSMLLLGGELQGKPHTVEATIERWKQQRGRRAELITGHCVITPKGRFIDTARTAVYFADATDEDIVAYAETGEPLECAGAFTLEAIGGWFIDRIEGDPSSVIGLSLPLVRRALYVFGYNAHEFWA
ncbi:Maf family protein [Corynebacterium vitaeruminis]|uniref:Nucleoside triphosphate pyrophosphatase n=1 Tax=Corynebacterium vitaeruminis DSM 20294 TaxID=1224164 RepID=W5XZA7_9CORY|nr:nucleoside triphosphate pyrophosphatase [Corynebacterium vitaeruminis]AHI21975.1 Maf-like protein [Corynebacterium vitaeruminis DSM 20294]